MNYRIIFSLFILFFSLISSSEAKKQSYSYFESDDFLVSHHSNYEWIVNGQKIKCDKSPVKIKINSVGFDTLIFNFVDVYQFTDTILTKFKSDERYIFTIGCCASGFDIHVKSRQVKLSQQIEEFPDQYDSLWMSSLEIGNVCFEVKNRAEKDTLVAVYGDFSGASMPLGSLLLSNECQKVFTGKGFYTTNVSQIIILKKTSEMTEIEGYPGEVEWGIDPLPFEAILKETQIRLFYKEKVKVIYDQKNNNWEIELLAE